MTRARSLLPATVVAVSLLGLQATPGCGKGDGVVDGAVTVVSQERGSWKLYSFDEDAVLLDDAGEEIVTDDPSQHEGWDLAISQWVIATNSGTAASSDSVGRGAILAVEGLVEEWADLADFTARCGDFDEADGTDNTGVLSCGGSTPTVDDGWVPDLLDDPDGAGPFAEIDYNPSLTFWFEYSFSGHEVFPYGHVYVVETHDGRCLKMQVTDYYDESGESGNVAFNWEFLPD